ncbi:MAG: TRAP transporter substrate-binding protein DctP [Devosia sp.]
MPLSRVRALVAAAVMVSAPAMADDTITLTYATYLPQSFTFVEVDDWFMNEVTTRTDGRVQFETYYGASLLKALDVMPGLAAGAADLATGAPGYNVDMLPLSSVIQPYITNKADAAVRAFVELYASEPALESEWEDNNMKLLYALAAVENTLWTDRPVTSKEDLEGMRIRATLGIAQSLEMLGATTVAMGMQDGVEALKRGVIDGFASSPFDLGVLVGLHNVAGHVNDAGNMGVYGIVTMAVNLDTWNNLPDDVKAVMEEVAAEVPEKFIEVTNRAVSDAVDTLMKTDTITVSLTAPEEDAAWKEETANAVWEKWVAGMDERGLDGRAMLDAYVALVKKHETDAKYRTGFEVYRERADQ